jgi:hypothetical protein
MATKSRGLTRPITRKQALSYKRLTPNGLGVTAIASVNGRRRSKKAKRNVDPRARAALAAAHYHAGVAGARAGRTAKKMRARAARPNRGRKLSQSEYRRRYAKTKKILGATPGRKRARPQSGLVLYRPPKERKPRARKLRAPRRPIVGIPMMSVGGDFPAIVPPRPKQRRRVQRPKETVTMAKPKRKSKGRKRSPAQRAAFKKMLAGLRLARGGKPVRRSAKRRSPAQKAALGRMLKGLARWRKVHGFKANPKARKGKAGRVYGGRFKSVTARVGKKKLSTYLYQTKKGQLKHIPLYALAGLRSKASVRRVIGKGGKRAEAYKRRVASVSRGRERAAGRVRFHGDIFTPNKKRGIVVPYETWSASMKPNRKKSRAKKKSKASHSRRKSAARRPIVHSSKRSRAAKKAAATRARKHEIRSKAAKKAARTRKEMRRNPARVAAATPNRRHRRRRHHTANRKHTRRYTDNRRHHRRHTANRRKTSYLPIRVARIHYESNRRRHHRRHYSQNPFNSKDFMKRLTAALKVGAVVGLGFGVHRALTKIVSDQILAKVFATGPLATYRGLLSGLIVGAGGMYAADAVLKGKAGEFNSGMFASFAHSVLTTLLTAAGQSSIAAALSAYPDAEGKAYHGMGEYVPVSGFGAYEMVSGLGATPLLSQAAAGMGDVPSRTRYGASPMIAQAAAGPPMLSQAAAGTGEYLAQGIQGIGDYEMVHGVGSSAFGMDDGIRPDLASAERALNIAEAAAGVALGDLPTASTLNPMMMAQPVDDAPQGMRAGILQGGDGIFG